MARRGRTKKEQLTPFNRWGCLVCPKDVDDTFGAEFENGNDFIAHVHEAHPHLLNADGKLPGQREGQLHLDGSDWFRNTFMWRSMDGAEMAIQDTGGPRADDDPMRFG